jgi:acyl dehydratase
VTHFAETSTKPLARLQIARYACAVNDFNPIHLDEEFAKAAGMPSVIAHGPLTAALVIDRLVAQAGATALAAADVRLRAPVFPGDALTVRQTEDGIEARKADGSLAVSVTVTVHKAHS